MRHNPQSDRYLPNYDNWKTNHPEDVEYARAQLRDRRKRHEDEQIDQLQPPFDL